MRSPNALDALNRDGESTFQHGLNLWLNIGTGVGACANCYATSVPAGWLNRQHAAKTPLIIPHLERQIPRIPQAEKVGRSFAAGT